MDISVTKKLKEEPDAKFLMVNIGVNEAIKNELMHFERYCYNSRCFKLENSSEFLDADVEVFSEHANNLQLECKFEVHKIVEKLDNSLAHVSHDPGRY